MCFLFQAKLQLPPKHIRINYTFYKEIHNTFLVSKISVVSQLASVLNFENIKSSETYLQSGLLAAVFHW